MRKIEMGRTGLMVTEIGFGGIPIIPLPMDEAVAVIRRCFERGINFYDTAIRYGDSEKKLGLALEDLRDQVFLATKTIERYAAGAAGHIRQSLESLRTEFIDIYQLHNVSKPEELEQVLAPGGAMEAMTAAMESGKIKHIGVTSHNIDIAIRACRTGRFATVQIPFNFIEYEPADELFGVAADYNMGVIGMKPLGGGLIGRPDLCMKWLQQYPKVMPIPGFAALSEADEVLDMYDSPQPLTDTDWADIEKLRVELGRTFCHRCGYCQPCEQGVKITEVLFFRSAAKRTGGPAAIALCKAAMQTVKDCIECGECSERCPYHLPIPELLREYLDEYRSLGGPA
ncbi:MAG: aldo/keto reductase [Pseudomonadota bacterium]